MKKPLSMLLLLLCIVQTMPARTVTGTAMTATKIIQQSQEGVAALSNQDIIAMVKANVAPDAIIAKIKASGNNFETMPADLKLLKDQGVPDAVILTMVMAPKNVAVKAQTNSSPAPLKRVSVKIPNLTIVDVEAPFTLTSQELRKGEPISFRVVNPVKVDGVIVIEQGATATARVVTAERGGHFGRAGRLAWTMQDVTAVDGTRIPLETAGRIVGDSHGAKVATAMIITGVIFWVAAPVALLHGFKRGENAILPAGKRLEVFVHGDVTITATAQ